MPAIYAIAALVAIVWIAVFLLRGSLASGCLGYLLITACFGYDFAHFPVGPINLTLDRLALAVLLGAYVVQRGLGRTSRRPPETVDLLLMALLGLLAVSPLWGQVPVNPKSLVLRLVGGYAIPFLVYWIARQTVLDRREISQIHGFFAVLGVYLGVTGLLEITGQWWAVFPAHIADPAVGLHFGRARGPMVHAVSYGLYLGVGLLAAWIWQWRFHRLGRLALLLPAPVMLAGVYGSYTRSVWMGVGLGLLLVLALTLHGAWRWLVVGGTISAAMLLARDQDGLAGQLPTRTAGLVHRQERRTPRRNRLRLLEDVPGPPCPGLRLRSVPRCQVALSGRSIHRLEPGSRARPTSITTPSSAS